ATLAGPAGGGAGYRAARHTPKACGAARQGGGDRSRARPPHRRRPDWHGQHVQGDRAVGARDQNGAGIRHVMLLQAGSLAAMPGVRHAFFTREGGVSQGIYASLNGGVGSQDDRAHVAENRARMAAALGVPPAALVTPYQIHSAGVAVRPAAPVTPYQIPSAEGVVAEAPWTHAARPRADAVVTRLPNLAVGVSTADCGPVLLADGAAGVIGAAHAGWRGALAGVIDAAIAAMERLRAEPAGGAGVVGRRGGPDTRQAAVGGGGGVGGAFGAPRPRQ